MAHPRATSPARPAARRPLLQPLEGRRLLAALVGVTDAAAATDTYALTVTPMNGATIAAATPLTSVAMQFTNPGAGGMVGRIAFSTFDFTLPSGAASLRFFDWVNNGTSLTTVRLDSNTISGQLRESWTLGAARVTHFGQGPGVDGTPQDNVSITFSSIAFSLQRFNANGTPNGAPLTTSWSTLTNNGSVINNPYDDGYLATTPAVVETVEMGTGQLPVVDAAFAFDTPAGTSGQPVAADVTYAAVDGPDSLPVFGYVASGVVLSNVVYERRNPATGSASQRYRLGTTFAKTYGFADSTLDAEPRKASFAIVAKQYQLTNYTYAGANNATQAAASVGWDYNQNRPYALAVNGAHVASPTDESRNTPLDSVTFQLLSPATLTLASFDLEGFTTAGLTLTAGAGNTSYTISGLAAQQTTDRRYAVKLFADRVNTLQTSSSTAALFIGTAGKSWTLDRSGPTVVAGSFDYDAAPPTPYAFSFQLSEVVTATATDGTAPVLIRRVDTGALVTTATARVAADGVTLIATLPASLADGRYRATLPAGSVRDAAGNLLAADRDLPFFVLAGDADHNGTVDFNDLLTLAQNYNATGRTFAQGNFDYSPDGRVDFNDLLILAQRYGTSVVIDGRASPAQTTRRSRASEALGL